MIPLCFTAALLYQLLHKLFTLFHLRHHFPPLFVPVDTRQKGRHATLHHRHTISLHGFESATVSVMAIRKHNKGKGQYLRRLATSNKNSIHRWELCNSLRGSQTWPTHHFRSNVSISMPQRRKQFFILKNFQFSLVFYWSNEWVFRVHPRIQSIPCEFFEMPKFVQSNFRRSGNVKKMKSHNVIWYFLFHLQTDLKKKVYLLEIKKLNLMIFLPNRLEFNYV